MSSISEVQVHPLEQIFDNRGKIMHMLRSDDQHFEKFGEIYFSVCHPGIIKGWHRHKDMTLNYACIYGRVKVVVYDGKNFQEIQLSPKEYNLLTVPPGLWNAFQAIGKHDAILANCATIPHDPSEIERIDPHDPSIPYIW